MSRQETYPSTPEDNHGLKLPSLSYLQVQTELKGEKSVKSIKSPVSISSDLNIRVGGGMYNFDMGQGLAAMEKKREKLEQLCSQMNNRKQEIAIKEKAVEAQTARFNELTNQVKILQEQNVQGRPSHPGITQIEKLFEEKTQKENELQEATAKLTDQLKGRKSQEESDVGQLIKATSEIDSNLGRIQKQLNVAREKQTTIQTSTLSTQIAESEVQIRSLQQELVCKEKEISELKEQRQLQERQKAETFRHNEATLQDIQKTHSEFKTQLQHLRAQAVIEKDQIQKLTQQEKSRCEKLLEDLKFTIRNLPASRSNAEILTQLQQQQRSLVSTCKDLQLKVSLLDRAKQQQRLQQVQSQNEKLKKVNESMEADLKANQEAKSEVNSLSQKILTLNNQIKSLQQQNKKCTKLKEEATTALAKQKQRQEVAYKQSEHYILQSQISKLTKKFQEEKAEYLKLQTLNQNYVPPQLIEQYKKRWSDYQEQLKSLQEIKRQNQQMGEELERLKQQKERVQWGQNTEVKELQHNIKQLNSKKESLTVLNKEFGKKLAQAQIKVKEYKEAHPEFEFKEEKEKKPKLDKKKLSKSQQDTKDNAVQLKDTKEGRDTKEVKDAKQAKDTKQTRDTKESKQSNQSKVSKELKEEKEGKQVRDVDKAQQVKESTGVDQTNDTELKPQTDTKQAKPQLTAPTKTPVVESNPGKPSPIKTKKQKGRTPLINEEQALIKHILEDAPSQDDEPQPSKLASKSSITKVKKLKNLNNKVKKGSQQVKSQVQQDMEFLMQQTKPQTPQTISKQTQVRIAMGSILFICAAWLLS